LYLTNRIARNARAVPKWSFVKLACLILSLLAVSTSATGKTLCNREDEIVFSCEVESENVSACMTSAGEVKYLYGSKDNVELELSSPVFSSASCSGGGISRLKFKNRNYSYIVYDVLCNSSSLGDGKWSKTDFAGLIVLSGERVIVNKKCTGFDDDVYGINSGVFTDKVEREDFNYDIP